LVETPKCRLCGKTEDMEFKNYSLKGNKAFWMCRICHTETKVPLRND
jgi:hypothetical protein